MSRPQAAVEAGHGRVSVRVSARSRQSSRLQDRVVVLHRQREGRDGRRFGYQVTFFRVGVDHTPANPSRWAVRDLLHDAPRRQRRRRPALPLQRETLARRAGARRSEDGSLPRVERRLDRDARRRSGIGQANTILRAERAAAGRHRPVARRGQAAGDQRHQRHQPERRAGRQRLALLLADAHADHAGRSPSTASGSRSPATAGWITSSAPASSSRSSAAGTGCRFNCPMAAS